MAGHTVYLCEKPDQGRHIAKALGGGTPTSGGINGPDWSVTWGFGHLLTPYMPQDYNEELKRWSWETLPIVPQKFEFKPKDGMSGKQLSAVAGFFKKATAVVISTDADREGELIAYEILNRIKWTGPTSRLWLSDLTIPAVQTALANLKKAEETKPLYWAAMARTYADWLVGMNMSRASTLKLAAPGSKPMSVGRVQTPVLALIVDLERKITGFKPEDYFEISAEVSTASGKIRMRYAPAPEKRLKDRAQAETLRARAEGARGPLRVRTEAKRQGPPALMDLNALQQECNGRFGWSADKALQVIQALYEQHHLLTYPRTDCQVLPEEHKGNIPTITGNLRAVPELQHLIPHLGSPVVRPSVYNDAKVTAHHAIVPTNKTPNLSELSADEKTLYLLVCKFWVAAHLPDMEYLQTTIELDASGVPLRASGRQVTKPGWKVAFQSAAGAETDVNADEKDKEKEAAEEENQTLPPLKDGEAAHVVKAILEAKKTKPPARFTEKTLLQAMKNVAAFVEDPAAKKTLKETSGIGTPATRANVIETLKARDYIRIKARQIQPTETAFVLIDAMRSVAPSYADPAMTARWEDVLEEIARGSDASLTKRFVDGIAGTVRKDVEAIRAADVKRMAAATGTPGGKPGGRPGGSGSGGSARGGQGGRTTPSGPGRIEGDWKAAIAAGSLLKVSFDDRDQAKALGARWDGDRKSWVAPKGVDLAPFRAAGFLA